MGRVVIEREKIIDKFFDELFKELQKIGLEVRGHVKAHTPVRTGYAQRSVFYAIIDEHGRVIGGDVSDDNGVSVSNHLPATGGMTVIIGANADYYIWIEIGARGRAGTHALADGARRVDELLRQWYSSAVIRIGP